MAEEFPLIFTSHFAVSVSYGCLTEIYGETHQNPYMEKVKVQLTNIYYTSLFYNISTGF